ncbi:hypothetical protein H0H93_002892 [Arthromyces matolae]|nr:hypothetical protein H0H93_002892 [Arthromyces matolae]
MTGNLKYRETMVMRHVLKHLRQRRLLTPYDSIISRSGLQPEHPLITNLYEHIVLRGDWKQAEDTLYKMSKTSLFDSFLHDTQPYAVWKQMHGTDADGDVPSPRGGHAMCIDPINDMIYLFGGWDGGNSLDDFWVYSVKDDRWRVLSHSTSGEKNAPGARSCHKMVFDTKTGSIYVLGRLNDSDSDSANVAGGDSAGPTTQSANGNTSVSPTKTYCSEFYRYHTRGVDNGQWDFLSFDTASQGGPPLIFDHQMVLDSEAQILYVFGGRIVDGVWDVVKYSGLYSYNIRLSKWKLLQIADPPVFSPSMIPARSGHSMVLEPYTSTLYIFAGQRDEQYLCDMFAYDIATNTAVELFSDFAAAGGPKSSFTQRAVIDPSLRELYVFCGLRRSRPPHSTDTFCSDAPNWMLSYDSTPGTWTQILSQSPGISAPAEDIHPEGHVAEPQPRYAHQVVYNSLTRTVFLHGGNVGMTHETRDSGEEVHKEERMDDLWQMQLIRAGSDEIVRRAVYQLRQQQFREMCEDAAPIDALTFLQTDVSAFVDHSDAKETEEFQSLLTNLLFPSTLRASSSPRAPSKVLPIGDKSPAVQDEKVARSVRGEDGSPPRKRSRSRSPEAEPEDEHEPDLEPWTNVLEDECFSSKGSVNVQALLEAEDPKEKVARSSSSKGDEGLGKETEQLTAIRFKQRTEVFERVLDFVSETAKQPEGNLLDIICSNSL